jgi:DNA-binding phage protein
LTHPDRTPSDDDYVAALLLLNIHQAARHDNNAAIAAKTGITPERLHEILTGSEYPDGYEIARFERAYGRNLWPGGAGA